MKKIKKIVFVVVVSFLQILFTYLKFHGLRHGFPSIDIVVMSNFMINIHFWTFSWTWVPIIIYDSIINYLNDFLLFWVSGSSLSTCTFVLVRLCLTTNFHFLIMRFYWCLQYSNYSSYRIWRFWLWKLWASSIQDSNDNR